MLSLCLVRVLRTIDVRHREVGREGARIVSFPERILLSDETLGYECQK